MTEEHSQIINDDDYEISLFELWKILVERKKIIAGVIIGFLVLSGIYCLIKKPVYQSKTSLQVGSVPNIGTIISPDVVIYELNEMYGKEKNRGMQLPYLHEVKIADNGAKNQVADVVSLIAYGKNPEEAQSLLQKINNNILAKHKEKYISAVLALKGKIASLEENMEILDHEIEGLNSKVESSGKDSEVVNSLLTFENVKLKQQRVNLSMEVLNLELQASELKARPTNVIIEPTVNDGPVNQKTKLFLAVALVSGAFMGVFVAFFMEFVERAKVNK